MIPHDFIQNKISIGTPLPAAVDLYICPCITQRFAFPSNRQQHLDTRNTVLFFNNHLVYILLVSMSCFADDRWPIMVTLVVMGVTLILAWLLHRLLKWKSLVWQRCDPTLPPGSLGLPLLGETLQFFTWSSSLDMSPFFKKRLER